jgi:hypothetical protein
MSAKVVKTAAARMIEVKSIKLRNGNLLVPRRNRETNRADWAEVTRDDPDYKRWWPVAVDEPDPRGEE